jgi:hypothetical protein
MKCADTAAGQPVCAEQMAETAEPTAADSPAIGDDLRVSLACPRCAANGWVALNNLCRAVKCAECGCRFQLGRGGRLQAIDELPHVDFLCPRCRAAGRIPEMLIARGVQCTACKLTLRYGEDRNWHAPEETNPMLASRTANVRSNVAGSIQSLWSAIRPADGGWSDKGVLAAGSAAVCLLLLIGYGIWTFGASLTVEGRARAFNRVCLSGDWTRAEAYLPDDAVQRAEFARWRVRHFSSILNKYRPDGDRLSVAAETLDESSTDLLLLVTLQSRHIGTRTIKQQWAHTDDGWRFDAKATIRAEDAIADERDPIPGLHRS